MLKVYPFNYTDFSSNGLAVLDKATNVKITRELNGEYGMSFDLPVDDGKWQYIKIGSIVTCEGQQFRVSRKTRQKQGALTRTVSCMHIMCDAADEHIPYFVEMIAVTPREVLVETFKNTAFHVMTTEEVTALGMSWVTDLTDIMPVSKKTPIEIIKILIETLKKGELYVDNRNIALVQRIGKDTGLVYALSHNLKSLSDTEDGDIVNRLYAYGKDDLPLPESAAPNGYIDSAASIAEYGLRKGYMDFNSIEDPDELLAMAQWQFNSNNFKRIDIPAQSYQVSMVDLYKIYGSQHKVDLGDSIVVKNSAMAIDTTQRIVKMEKYPYSPSQHSTATLGNPPQTYEGLFRSLANTERQYKKAVAQNGAIKSDYLDAVRAMMQTEANSVLQRAAVYQQASVYVDNVNNPTKAILIGNGIIAIANSKKDNGDWNWRTGITGDRIIADEVDTEWVYAGKLTGNVIKTAETGKRIEFSNNCQKTYNADNKLEGMAFGDGVGARYGDQLYYDNGNPAMKINNTVTDGFSIEPVGDYKLGLGAYGKFTTPQGTWNCGFAEFQNLSDGTNYYMTENEVSGSFTTVDGKTITVERGKIISII